MRDFYRRRLYRYVIIAQPGVQVTGISFNSIGNFSAVDAITGIGSGIAMHSYRIIQAITAFYFVEAGKEPGPFVSFNRNSSA